MKDLHKTAMIIGVVAMLGLGLLLCFVPPKGNEVNHISHQYEIQKEP